MTAPLRAVALCSVSTAPQAIEDKDSLPTQEAEARALCARENWQLVSILTVPGHSRHYVDIHECARDMAKEGITAYLDLLHLWDTSGFDVLICRDGSRFARTQSLHAYVVERTINIGARIYSFADGFIDRNNYRMFAAMSGYSAAHHVDQLTAYRKIGLDKRARRGLPVGNFTLMPFRVVRDDLGKALGVELKPELRRLWDDLATLFLEGVGFEHLEYELATRYKHFDPDTGLQYPWNKFRVLLLNPYFWGNSGTGYGSKRGLWAFDENEPLPRGAIIYRNTHEAVYTGQQAAQIQAELRRRTDVIRGRASPHHSYWFTGLVNCDGCQRVCSGARAVSGRKTYVYLRCSTNYESRFDGYREKIICANHTVTREATIKKYLDSWLRQLILADDLETHFSSGSAIHEHSHKRAEELQHEVAALEQKLRSLVNQVGLTQVAVVQQALTDHINTTGAQVEELRGLLAQEQRALDNEAVTGTRRAAFEELKALGVDGLWKLPHTQINQLLHRLFGHWRLRMRDGEIVGRMLYFRGRIRR